MIRKFVTSHRLMKSPEAPMSSKVKGLLNCPRKRRSKDDREAALNVLGP